MSRIDDDTTDRRIQEARLAERRVQESIKKKREAQVTAFDRALAQKAGDSASAKARGSAAAQDQKQGSVATRERQAMEGLRGSIERDAAMAGRALASAGRDRLGEPSPDPAANAAARSLSRSRAEANAKSDARSGKGSAEARSEEIAQEVAGGGRSAGPLRGRRGGGGTSSDDEKSRSPRDDSKSDSCAPFRPPPAALLPPPPLARPVGSSGVRLGALKEIVENIVKRASVGTNGDGVPEFRLDLKSDVLSGLSIRVSGGRGRKIRAVFSGSDSEVLAALKRSSSELSDALMARGLTLEDVRFEDTDSQHPKNVTHLTQESS